MSTSAPFSQLHDDLSWFVTCPEIRVLHIATGGTERAVVLEQVALTEGHALNHSPFFLLEDAHTKDERGWSVRADRMRVLHEARRTAMASEGYVLAPLPPRPPTTDPLLTFGSQVEQCLEAQAGVRELDGLVIALAPAILENGAAFAEAILSLVNAASLSTVRFIVVELGDASAEPLLRALGPAGMRTTCTADPAELREEQSETLAAAASALPGASPEMQAGFAGPKDIVAPARFGKPARDAPLPPEVQAQLARDLGPSAALLGPGGRLLKQRVLGAALAIQEGRHADASRLQTEARDQCLAAGMTKLGGILEVALAAYLLQAGSRPLARSAFEAAATRATAEGMFDLTAQALFGLAAVLALDGEMHPAAECYARAGEAAEKGGSPLLAVEAYRTAGQVAMRAKAEGAALAAWKRALNAASALSPEMAATSSAPLVARSLAKVLQDNGSFAAAASLLAQAEELERPPAAEDGTAPAEGRADV